MDTPEVPRCLSSRLTGTRGVEKQWETVRSGLYRDENGARVPQRRSNVEHDYRLDDRPSLEEERPSSLSSICDREREKRDVGEDVPCSTILREEEVDFVFRDSADQDSVGQKVSGLCGLYGCGSGACDCPR